MTSTNVVRFLKYVAPLFAYCALIYLFSSLSAPPTPDIGFELGDKVVHAGAYGVMMILAFRASHSIFRRRSQRVQLLAALLFCVIYGATDEIHQSFVPSRDADIFDWVADAFGAVVAVVAILVVRNWRIGHVLFGEREQ